VGSSSNLVNRFYGYFNLKYLVKQSNSLICKSLLKHGHSAFSLEILEYCEPSEVIAKEQYYLDKLKPEYNILTVAGSSYGSTRSAETRAKIVQANLGRKHTDKTKMAMSIAKLGKKHTEEALAKMKGRVLSENHLAKVREHLLKLNNQKATKVKIIDTETNVITECDSIINAAKYLEANQTTIGRYLKAKKLYKNRYAIVLA
jgi:group I intron endonuclease